MQNAFKIQLNHIENMTLPKSEKRHTIIHYNTQSNARTNKGVVGRNKWSFVVRTKKWCDVPSLTSVFMVQSVQ